VGRNKKVIEAYIRNQIQDDIVAEQLYLKELVDPFTGEPVTKGK
jgi:putative transposase